MNNIKKSIIYYLAGNKRPLDKNLPNMPFTNDDTLQGVGVGSDFCYAL